MFYNRYFAMLGNYVVAKQRQWLGHSRELQLRVKTVEKLRLFSYYVVAKMRRMVSAVANIRWLVYLIVKRCNGTFVYCDKGDTVLQVAKYYNWKKLCNMADHSTILVNNIGCVTGNVLLAFTTRSLQFFLKALLIGQNYISRNPIDLQP